MIDSNVAMETNIRFDSNSCMTITLTSSFSPDPVYLTLKVTQSLQMNSDSVANGTNSDSDKSNSK